jgi:hypothetical protein
MITWIEKAMKSGTQIFIIGITGKHWSDTPYQQLVQDKILFQSTHRMCHYNYKMDKTLKEPAMYVSNSFPIWRLHLTVASVTCYSKITVVIGTLWDLKEIQDPRIKQQVSSVMNF